MATLVLSTVGNAFGGPVGGAIGALIGQSIDQQLFASSSRGPRLGDLKVQSSSYGTQLPQVYGTMRIAGTVIWATDLVESSTANAAKSQPETSYNYTVSLAVALSSREVKRIGRIWADGKLLRGAEGDFKVGTKFRFYAGTEDQVADPLIASAEGIANTPAYRGLALAIFEDLELAEFGNRIPFMTFEVVADDGAVSIAEIASEASAGVIECTDGRKIGGYAAYGDTAKAALQPLVDCFALELFDDGSRLASPSNGSPLHIRRDAFVNSSDEAKPGQIQREQTQARALPNGLRLAYYDPALDYQSGEARASGADRQGTETQRELPATLAASDAKSLAQAMIAREWARRDKLTLRLAPSYMGLEPGTRVDLDLLPRGWSVEQCTIDGFVTVAELRPTWSTASQVTADSGRIVVNQDYIIPDPTLALFDVPDVLGLGYAGPALLLAVSNPGPSTKNYAVDVSAGAQSIQEQSARRKSVLGRATSVLGSGDQYLINDSAWVEIELIDPDQWLLSCDDEALVAGANLAILGRELFQFGVAEALGDGRFRLSRLVRGRAGTDWAMGGHDPGELFALLAPQSVRPLLLPAAAVGATVNAAVRGAGGTIIASAAMVLAGESLRPLSPIGLNATLSADGELSLRWTRRSRQGFAWIDEIDAPLGEAVERYRVTISGTLASVEIETGEPTLLLSPQQLAQAGPGRASVEVRQIGDAAASHPAQLTIII